MRLSDFQVLQRGTDGFAALPVEGRVLRDGDAIVRSEDGLLRVPTGGPYVIEAEETAREVMVGDIWVLAGQSNMEGCGLLQDVEPPSPMVRSYGFDERWTVAAEPLHILAHAIDPVHNELSPEEREAAVARGAAGMETGAGLGLRFAKEVAARTGVPIGLLPCAHGGTSMSEWDPGPAHEGGRSLYGSMLRRFHAAGGRVRGMLWYQGESDALGEGWRLFAGRWREFVRSVRRDFGDPALPIVWAQISKVTDQPDDLPGWDAVREAQRSLEAELQPGAVVSTTDLPMEDPIHISTEGLRRLGVRMAKMALRTAYGIGDLDLGPRLESARFAEGGRTVRVTFSHANGPLLPAEGIRGFSISAEDGAPLDAIACAVIEGTSVVRLVLRREVPATARLWYGRGSHPECDLTDSSDLAALAFGPIPIGNSQLHSPS